MQCAIGVAGSRRTQPTIRQHNHVPWVRIGVVHAIKQHLCAYPCKPYQPRAESDSVSADPSQRRTHSRSGKHTVRRGPRLDRGCSRNRELASRCVRYMHLAAVYMHQGLEDSPEVDRRGGLCGWWCASKRSMCGE
jgi:hypothetical protein